MVDSVDRPRSSLTVRTLRNRSILDRDLVWAVKDDGFHHCLGRHGVGWLVTGQANGQNMYRANAKSGARSGWFTISPPINCRS